MKKKSIAYQALEAELQKRQYYPLRSLLVWQKDKFIFEYDAYGSNTDILHEAQSTSKSIQTLLLGAVQKEGFLTDLDQKIKPFFEEYNYLDWSNGKSDMTLRNLITMQAGLDWNEGRVSYNLIDENHSNRLSASDNWIEFALNRPMKHPPGDGYQYSSAAPIMLSKIIKEATQKTNKDWLEEALFTPLGITHYDVVTCPHESDVLGDVELCPKDLLKIGRLVLQKGMWEGKEIIPAEWIEYITSPILKIDDQRTYGAMWWQGKPPLTFCELVYAWGIGGQHIFLLPEFDAVVVTMGRFYEIDFDLTAFHLLNQWVLPLLKKQS